MADETSNETKCPFCGSQEDCPHLVGVIDRSFLAIDGGYLFDHDDAPREALAAALRGILGSGESPLPTGWEDLDELVETAIENHDPKNASDPWYFNELIDGDKYFDVLISGLEESAVVVRSDTEGGPGMSSVRYLAWSENPEATVRTLADAIGESLTVGRTR